MKLKNKLLTILAPVATVAAITPVMILTGCNNKSTNSVSYSGEKTLTITSAGTTLEFTLTKALENGEDLKVVPKGITGDYPSVAITKIEGKKITVSLNLLSTGASHSKFGLEFQCYNSSSKLTPIWTSSIPGFDVTKTN